MATTKALYSRQYADYRGMFADHPILDCNFDPDIPLPTDPALIAEDSRGVRNGGLFFALRGEKTDGHRYISSLADSGCTVVAEEIPQDYRGRYLRVADTRAANAFFWSRFYGEPAKALQTVAVTGTNGKTTVTSMLEAIASVAGMPYARIGTGGSRVCGNFHEQTLTTPSPRELYALLREAADGGARAVFMEASSHAIAYRKLLPMQPDIAVFTGLGEDHLDYHGSMEAYASAKAELFRRAKAAILNGDSPYTERMRAALPKGADCRICSASSRFADFMAQNIEDRGAEGVRYDLISENAAIRIVCPAPGDFTVMNSLQAASAALFLGLPPRDISLALRRFTGAPGRMERVTLPGASFRAYVDYAHTPDALRRALATLRKSLPQGGRLLVLFGCGGERDREKRPLMGRAAAEEADLVILTEDNSRGERREEILAEILAGIPADFPRENLFIMPDRREAIEKAIALCREGDILLAAGKGNEHYTVQSASGGREPYAGDHTVLEQAYKAAKEHAS